ncbi:MAG: tetratricopeptide repeat protein [Anaerolineae bacterium]|nr:tetratricopeptide repeat protein [Anaerolineae bacterium]
MANEKHTVSKADKKKAQEYSERGLRQYERWEIDDAVKSFELAAQHDPSNPDHYLNLARALARFGDYDRALHALADFIRYEGDTELAARFEQLFANAMDEVETLITERMTASGIPLEEVGAAIQMWLEYRIALGRRPLTMRKPETWAAALDYTVRKVNFREITQREIEELYGVSNSALRSHFNELVETLDIMPCDYRYFRGDNNPLDKLVEAAAMLERLEKRFRQD